MERNVYRHSDNEYLKNATLHFNSTALPTAEFSVITEEDVYVKNISEISGSIAFITTKYNDGILLISGRKDDYVTKKKIFIYS